MTRLFRMGTIARLAAPWLAMLPMATNADPAFSPGSRFSARQGEAIYASVCVGCHMPGGVGATGAAAYPPLARNARLIGASYVSFMVVRGNKAMPGFAAQLDDEQVAEIVNYVRSHFGNAWTDTVSPADVASLRP